jgi:hypothetical protein
MSEVSRQHHYLQLAVKVRALAREAHYPAARKALIEVAKRFDQGAGAPAPSFSREADDNGALGEGG